MLFNNTAMPSTVYSMIGSDDMSLGLGAVLCLLGYTVQSEGVIESHYNVGEDPVTIGTWTFIHKADRGDWEPWQGASLPPTRRCRSDLSQSGPT